LFIPRPTRSPFQTREEIERQIARGGLSEAETADLWDCLFLTVAETDELLEYVRTKKERFLA
jgi:hypothetical protein